MAKVPSDGSASPLGASLSQIDERWRANDDDDATKSWVSWSASVTGSADNVAGQDHTFTVHVTYNDGSAFKLTCRTSAGVIVTIIADNYYGYCKKEVKTQVSYAANLFGNCEEEHAGGALAFPSWSLGIEYSPGGSSFRTGRTFAYLIADRLSAACERPAIPQAIVRSTSRGSR